MLYRYVRLLSLLTSLALYAVALAAHIPKEVTVEPLYKRVEQQCLAAVPWEEEEWPNESYYDYLKRCIHYQTYPITTKKRRAAFKILSLHKENTQQVSTSALNDSQTWLDLYLFCGQQDPTKSLLSFIDRTHTEIGRASLALMLAEPKTDTAEIYKSQSIVRELIENEALYNALDKHLNDCARAENHLISFWMRDSFSQAAKKHYFNFPSMNNVNDVLNKSANALELRTWLEHVRRYAWLVCDAGAAVILPASSLYEFGVINAQRVPENLKRASEGLRGSGGTVLGLIRMKADENNWSRIVASISLITGGYCGLSTKENYEWARDNVYLDTCLQKKLNSVALYTRALKSISSTAHSSSTMTSNLPSLRALNDFLVKASTMPGDLKQLFDILDTPTFKKRPSLTSHTGRVLVAYSLMDQVKNEWIASLAALGELDAYMSMAKLYKEQQYKECSYCFVELSSLPQPVIDMQEFWNPLIKARSIVTNSIRLGASSRANAVITGPNAGGKSTMLRSITLNVVLAQTFGIAAAKRFTLTPFSVIASYLNISDDIAAGNSLFKSEVIRAQYLIDLVLGLKPNEFGCVVVDEMFSGTSSVEGEAASYSVAKYLGSAPNVISMIASHFPLLTRLEKDTNFFSNYMVSVKETEDGKIEYPFKLEHGISNQNIAIAILRAEGFASSILDDAALLIKENSKKAN